MLKLYNYWRSTSSYRTRILLNLKGVDWEYVPVNILKGEQHGEAYRKVSPNGFVPVLVDGDLVVRQTVMMVDYLDRTYPESPLVPTDEAGRMRVMEFLLSLTGDVQGRTQKRVRDYIEEHMSRDVLENWFAYWAREGLSILEKLAVQNRPAGRFFHGDTPGAADAFIVAQLFNFGSRATDMSVAPTLLAIAEECAKLEAFQKALPEVQPDYAADPRF